MGNFALPDYGVEDLRGSGDGGHDNTGRSRQGRADTRAAKPVRDGIAARESGREVAVDFHGPCLSAETKRGILPMASKRPTQHTLNHDWVGQT